MGFQIKDFTSIVASMVNRMKVTTRKITDYNIGSVARTLVEAPAVEIDELYQQVFHGIRAGIQVATYNTFNFSLLPAVPASGTMRVTITAQATDTLIPAGTVFTRQGSAVIYTSAADLVIADGDTIGNVRVAANIGGIATNIPASMVFTANPTPSGFVSATNPAAFINGSDLETEDQRKLRFNDYIQTLQRGTVAALEYGAKQAAIIDSNGVESERVRLSKVIEPWVDDDEQPVGLINLYIHNGVGSTSNDLVAKANTVLYGYRDTSGKKVPGWKAAGPKLVVLAATEQSQNIAGVLTPAAGYDGAALNAQAESVITNYMLGLDIGDPLECAEIIFRVKSIPGVDNFVLGTPDPSADVAATSAHHKIMPGTFAITNP